MNKEIELEKGKWASEVTQSCLTLRPHGLKPARLLRLWDSPGNNTGVGCHFLLQEIFPTENSNPHLLHWLVDCLTLHFCESQYRFAVIFPRKTSRHWKNKYTLIFPSSILPFVSFFLPFFILFFFPFLVFSYFHSCSTGFLHLDTTGIWDHIICLVGACPVNTGSLATSLANTDKVPAIPLQFWWQKCFKTLSDIPSKITPVENHCCSIC